MSNFHHIFLCTVCSLTLLATKGHAQKEVSFLSNIFNIQNFDSLHQDNPVSFYRTINTFNLIQKSRLNKSQTDYTYVLDSTVRYDYDIITPIKDGKAHYLYDTVNNKELALLFFQDSLPNQLVAYSYTSRHYNDQGFFIKQSFNPWDGDYKNLDESNPLNIQSFYYNNNGLLERSESQGRQEIEENRPSSVRHFYYNDNQLLERYEYYSWDHTLDSLTLKDYTLYRHNEQNLLDNVVQWDLHPVRGWEYDDSTSYIYNVEGQLIREIFYNWNPTGVGLFYPSYENIFYYNQDGTKQRIEKYSGLIESNNTWRTRITDEYAYHNYGSLSTITKIDSVYPYMIPEDYFETKYFHDEHILQENVQLPRTLDQGFHEYQNHILLTRQENSIRYGISPVEKVEYFYSKLPTTSTQEVIQENVVSIYPNPVMSDIIHISAPDFASNLDATIYDINGQILFHDQIKNNNPLSVACLDPGIYIIRISAGGKYLNGKFVKL